MHQQILVRTFSALAILIVGCPSPGTAQTNGQRTPFREQHRQLQDPLVATKAAAAKVARSKGKMRVPRSETVGTFLTFDAPGAAKGTSPAAVTTSGIIVGSYTDANSLTHGFLRAANGAFSTFDVPGAVYGTYPLGVNTEGATVGTYGDNIGSGEHSFVRDRDGAITTFDPPVENLGSEATAINSNGTVTGSYYDGEYNGHGFSRNRDGAIVILDAPEGSTPNDNGLSPSSISADGSILGIIDGNSFFKHTGFLMNASGGFSEITGPGGLRGQDDPYSYGPPISINPAGEVAGTYFQPISGNPFGGNFRAFVRFGGLYEAFDAANYPPCCIWSAANGINAAGTVAGAFNDGYGINHGFWRTSAGTVTTFDVPGAGTGVNQGTQVIGITTAGVIAGEYRDANNVSHGYLFRPH